MSDKTAEGTAAVESLDIDLTGVEWTSVILKGVAILVPGLLFLPLATSRLGFIVLPILYFSVMAVGYNVMVGWPNLLVFCPAALAIIGGVSSALLAQTGVPFVLAFLLGGVVAGLVGALIALFAVIIRTPFDFVIATLAFEQLVFYGLVVWDRVGPAGLRGIPNPELLGMELTSQFEMYLFLLGVLVISVMVVASFDNSLLGTLSIATSENEDLLTSIGYQPSKYKFVSIVLGAFLLGIGGALYAHTTNLVVPNSFTLTQTVFLLTIIVVGGLRTIYGPVVGAIIMVGIPEFSRLFGISGFQKYLIGAALIGIILFAPRGVVGNLQNRSGPSIMSRLKGMIS